MPEITIPRTGAHVRKLFEILLASWSEQDLRLGIGRNRKLPSAPRPCAAVAKRLIRRRYVRFWGSPDMADYPPRLVYDANDRCC